MHDGDLRFGDFQLLAVYTRSSLAEQSTPVSFSFQDVSFQVENVTFGDLDLDAFDLGGTLSWAEPSGAALYYEVYIARSLADGSAEACCDLRKTCEELLKAPKSSLSLRRGKGKKGCGLWL